MKTIFATFLLILCMVTNLYAGIIYYYKDRMDKGFKCLAAKKYDESINIFNDIVAELEPEIRRMGYRSSGDVTIYTKAVANYGLGSALIKKSEIEKGETKKRDYTNGVKALKSSCANGCEQACREIDKERAAFEDAYGKAIAQLKNMSHKEGLGHFKNKGNIGRQHLEVNNSIKIEKEEKRKNITKNEYKIVLPLYSNDVIGVRKANLVKNSFELKHVNLDELAFVEFDELHRSILQIYNHDKTINVTLLHDTIYFQHWPSKTKIASLPINGHYSYAFTQMGDLLLRYNDDEYVIFRFVSLANEEGMKDYIKMKNEYDSYALDGKEIFALLREKEVKLSNSVDPFKTPKGEFENTIDYQSRLNKLAELEKKINKEYIRKAEIVKTKYIEEKQNLKEKLVNSLFNYVSDIRIDNYNADDEYFTAYINSLEVKLPIDRKIARDIAKRKANLKIVGKLRYYDDKNIEYVNTELVDVVENKRYPIGNFSAIDKSIDNTRIVANPKNRNSAQKSEWLTDGKELKWIFDSNGKVEVAGINNGIGEWKISSNNSSNLVFNMVLNKGTERMLHCHGTGSIGHHIKVPDPDGKYSNHLIIDMPCEGKSGKYFFLVLLNPENGKLVLPFKN